MLHIPLFRLSALVFLLLGTTACMTATRGTSAEFYIITEPPGASVVTNLQTKENRKARRADSSIPVEYHRCEETPCSFEVSRRDEFELWIELDGYHKSAACIESEVQLLPTSAAAAQAGAGIGGSQVIVATAAPTTISGAFSTALWAGTAATAGLASATVDTTTGAILGPTPNPLAVELLRIGEEPPAMRHEISPRADMSKINQPDAHAIELEKRELERAKRCVAKLKTVTPPE